MECVGGRTSASPCAMQIPTCRNSRGRKRNGEVEGGWRRGSYANWLLTDFLSFLFGLGRGGAAFCHDNMLHVGEVDMRLLAIEPICTGIVI